MDGSTLSPMSSRSLSDAVPVDMHRMGIHWDDELFLRSLLSLERVGLPCMGCSLDLFRFS